MIVMRLEQGDVDVFERFAQKGLKRLLLRAGMFYASPLVWGGAVPRNLRSQGSGFGGPVGGLALNDKP